MSLTYFQEPFEESWLWTDGGIDDEKQDPALSRQLHKTLRTKFLWHFVPTFLTVQGTIHEQPFLIYASAIWASHWPEDATYGEKPLHKRTALLKRVIYPPEFSSGDFNIEDLELHLGMDRYEAHAMKKNRVAQVNIQSYQQTLREYAPQEVETMWYHMLNAR
ncbi:hypothetical protein F5879DRAFT_991917 [Lentinula edodes]|nr:hypothetical protein F5879DRAFT_991917 [Lentinula edodes]